MTMKIMMIMLTEMKIKRIQKNIQIKIIIIIKIIKAKIKNMTINQKKT